MGGWYLKFGPDLPVSEDKTDELVAAENVDVEEELARAKTAMRAVTMPNLSLHPAKLEEGVQHASTDTAIFMGNASSRQTMMNRVATYIVPSSGTNPVGEHMTIPEGELKYEASLFKRNVSSMGNVLWKQDEHLFGVVKEVQIPETNLLRFKNMWQKSLTNMGTDTWPLDAEQLYLCRKMGLIRKLPDISEEDIKDRSKSDFLVEAIAVTQLLWFCIQLIGRAVEHLAITQLEIFVLAFATCSALTYLLHLKKPKDIMNPYYISAVRYPTSKEVYTIASRGSVDFGLVQKYQCVSGNAIHRCLDNVDQRDIFALLSLGSSSLFGALHLLAWNFHFPTNVELWLWRVASLYITIAPLFGSGTIVPVVTAVRHGAPRGLFKIRIRAAMVKLNISVVLFFGVLFTLCRVFILAEALRTLGYLEPSAFTQTWSVNLPHIG
ncbi:MAG: hypothetical protein M1822_004275 [Bathelium mastoideum]|nr:MAG: hypothetical protein M1822_004275 [Bathelium mastoideum]